MVMVRQQSEQRLHRPAVADQADSEAFDGQCPRAPIDDDRRKIGVLGDQPDNPVLLMETLDGHLVIKTGLPSC